MARTTPVNSGYTIIPGTTTGTNGSKVDTWLEYKILSQSIANNTSEIRVILYSQSTVSSTTKWTTAENFGYVTYDESTKQYLRTAYDFSNKAVVKFADHTFVISHSSDGTKSINLKGAWSTSHSSYISGGSVSGIVTLPTIYQSSTLTISGPFTIGTESTVTINKRQPEYTHSIVFACGGTSTTLYTKTSQSQIGITIPTSYLSKLPTSTSRTGTLTITTYDENDQLTGSRDYEVTINVSASAVPTVTSFTASEAGNVPVAWNNTFVQGKSKIMFRMTATAPSGTQIDYYVIEGMNMSGGSPLVTDVIPTYGTFTVNGYAVDKRGRRSTTSSITVTVYPYSVPRMEGIECYRCTLQGTPDVSGSYISVKATGIYSDCNGQNFGLLYVRTRIKGGTYGQKIALQSGVAEIVGGISITSFYDVEISIEDAFTTTAIVNVVNSADRIMNINSNGKGLAIGSFSTANANELFEVFWDTDFKRTPKVNGVPIGGGGGGDVPTKLSQLQNDTGFITSSDIPPIPSKTSQLQNDSGYIKQTDIPTIPSKTSDLTNDSGFITNNDIPPIPTESTVSGWGFTKNTGTYSKPSGGIPKTDFASAVQTSLGKADTALQSYTESDPVFSASPASGITSDDIARWNNGGGGGTLVAPTPTSNLFSATTGGYIKEGRIVTVHIVATVKSATASKVIFTGLPLPLTGGTDYRAILPCVNVANSTQYCVKVGKTGTLYMTTGGPQSGTIAINGSYIAES